MTPQMLGLIGFGAVILLLSIVMWPTARKLDGRQKYRRNRIAGADVDPNANSQRSVAPFQILLATLLGGGIANSVDTTNDNSDTSDDGGSGDSGGSDGGGGGSGGE